MNYERNLTFNLRLRGMSDAEIGEALDEVRAHQATAGTPVETEFGTAEEYAKQFPRKKRRTRGSIITVVGLSLAIAYIFLVVLLMLLFKVDVREFIGPLTLPPAVAVVLAGVVAGFLTDYFRPAPGSAQSQAFLHRDSD